MKAEIGVGLSVALLSAAAGWWIRRGNNKNSIPTEWLEIGKIEELILYPLKSGLGTQCKEFDCTRVGAKLGDSRDRVFAVVNEDGKLVTGRDYPLLTQVAAKIDGTVLTLSAKEMEAPFTLDVTTLNCNVRQDLRIWKVVTNGVDCGDKAAAWISACLKAKLRLLYFPETVGKTPFTGFQYEHTRQDDGGAFSDTMAFLLVNNASVQELNSRLQNPVNARYFRPNIVVSGEKLIPYEEDRWEWVKIGDVVFRTLGPCTRCLFTTVDPASGVRAEDWEPVKTLRKFRSLRGTEERSKWGSSPVMGQYLGVRVPGVIKTGDVVSLAKR